MKVWNLSLNQFRSSLISPAWYWKLFLIVGFWRSGLLLIASKADKFLIYKPSFPYADVLLHDSGLPKWIYSWANFDGVHYLTIIANGYKGTGLIQAFFPLFPYTVKLSTLFTHPIVGSLFLNFAFLFGTTIFLFLLVRETFSEKAAWWSVISLLVFPSAFFLGAMYSEAMFMFLVLGSFYFARTKKWYLAIILAALASATRLVGVFLLPALVIEYLSLNQFFKSSWWSFNQIIKFFRKHWLKLFFLIFSGFGLLVYMLYLKIEFNDPLYFFHVQSEFGGGRQESLVLYPQVLWRYVKILSTLSIKEIGLVRYQAFVQEFIAGTLGLLGLILAARRVPLSWTVFSLGAFFLPILTGTFSSMPRYLLVCFPLFVLGGRFIARKPLSRSWILVIASICMVVNAIVFIQGYWIA